MTGAIIGASVIGAASSYSASKSASESADKQAAVAAQASAAQADISQQQLDFQKEQYDDWEAIFGPIQENLSAYYQRLTPDSYAAQGLQGLQESYAQSRKSLEQSLAQRGISDSGIAAAAQAQLEMGRMLGGAQIKAGAQEDVLNKQTQFLGIGLGQQGALQQGVSSSYGNMASVYGQQAQNALALQGQFGQQAAAAQAGVGQALGSGISSYMTYQAIQQRPYYDQQPGFIGPQRSFG